MPKLYILSTQPGIVRVSTTPTGYRGVQMPVLDLIKGLAQRGRARA